MRGIFDDFNATEIVKIILAAGTTVFALWVIISALIILL